MGQTHSDFVSSQQPPPPLVVCKDPWKDPGISPLLPPALSDCPPPPSQLHCLIG